MNKLTIPAILAATVLVAGMFAFMPVEQASTVHTSGTLTIAQADIDTLTGSASGVIVTTAIGDGADDLYDGTITFDFDAGIDAANIVALYLCDFDLGGADAGDDITITVITVFGGVITTGAGVVAAGTPIEQDAMVSGECVEIIEDGILTPLVGDGANDIVFTLDETDGGGLDDDTDGASVIAVITGIEEADDVTVTSTTADA